ncbi:response regulator [Martelella endophytica]|uniref:Chemotaxis protein CheY n=1 Tax=Martelella endophytica TaxID=1486262 RepID=A0A0D5LPF5_MAREN|nr:response regulator [Martelella endophytica]AJY46001.1 chemotaxis protein CheY [Martelella endophytica]
MEHAMSERPGDDAPHLLIVDDDTRIRTLLKRYLGEHGYRVSTAGDAAEARRKLEGLDFDLLVLDVMMPGEDGIELTRSLADIRPVPVLLLTAKAEAESRILGLEAGADDYLAKPFEPRELLLRISNILRRAQQPKTPAIEQVMFGPYTFSLARKELKRGATAIRLTEREQDIMTMLAENAGETVARYDLVSNAADINERTIDVQINRLRRKIETDPANPIYLQTVRGIGYRLTRD